MGGIPVTIQGWVAGGAQPGPDISGSGYTGTTTITFIAWGTTQVGNGFDLLSSLADFTSAAGSVLSLGLTDKINNWSGASSVINHCSAWHTAGTITGIALTSAIGGAYGAEAAEANAGREGFEFSHWIPARMGGPRSIFNGNFVSEGFHYLTDPFRYPAGWQAWGSKLPAAAQQVLRIPWVYDGAAVGAAAGTASAAANGDRGCH